MTKNRIDVSIDQNKIIDDGNGILTFRGGLTLSDETTQRNGTRYDIASLDISQFDGTVFADHDYSVTSVVGKAIGVGKRAKRLMAQGVEFAVKESPLARYTYEMVRGGFINAVSIGTMIDQVDEKGDEVIFKNAELIEFSFVGLGNNRSARINEIAINTLKESESEGLETKQLRSFLEHNHVSLDDLEEEMEEPNQEEDIIMEPKENKEQVVEEKKEEPKSEVNSFDAIKNAITEAMKPLTEKVESLEKNAFNKNAVEPQFVPTDGKDKVVVPSKNQFATMSWQDRAQLQIESFFKGFKQGDSDATKTLHQINQLHKEKLVEAGKISKNALTMADFGNFVTSPELLTQIEGYRSDYSAILGQFPYRETNSLQMAWLNRVGDIDMTHVVMCDDGADGNLKPVSEYTATERTKNLEEMAAVTPVCTAATIFLAADLLEDVSAGYRMSYDRNLARGIVAALEIAAEDNDTASIAESGDLANVAGANAWLGDIRQAIFAISQGEGILVMNEATFGLIWNALLLVGNGAMLSQQGLNGTTSSLWTKGVVVVPNDLMPTLGDTATYKTFVIDGSNVVINHAIFYVNPANFSGRQNGGLRYDLSTDAAYEVSGVVKSAFQRNEIVLRGSMFRGAVIRDNSRVGAVRAGAVIS